MFKKLFSIILIFLILISTFSLQASAFTPTDFDVRSKSVLLVSLDNGKVIYSKNADEKRYPASLTKIMTALVMIEKTKDFDKEKITVSRNAIDSLLGTGSSMGGLKEGEILTAKQMLYLLLMSSANEGSIAIAEHYCGSVDKFVEEMNSKAKALGMKNTHYVNTHGLHDDDHYTTVNDMYKLITEALKHPLFEEIVTSKQYQLAATNKNPARTLVTTNLMMLAYYPEHFYKYAKGIKTGFTDEAGRCLISTAEKDGYTYLCILMKSTAYDKNNNFVRYEFEDSAKLYEWAFNDFEYKSIVEKDKIIGEAKVELSLDTDFVSYVPQEDFSTILPKTADSSTISFDIKLKKDTFKAPIKAGEVLGTADIIFANEKLGSVNVVASQSVERSTVLYIWDIIKKIFSSKAMKVLALFILILVVIFCFYCYIINQKRKKRKIKRYKKMREKDFLDKK